MDCVYGIRDFIYVRLGLVPGRHPKINLFVLHYCVICCEVETKLKIAIVACIFAHFLSFDIIDIISASASSSVVQTFLSSP